MIELHWATLILIILVAFAIGIWFGSTPIPDYSPFD